MPLHSELSSAGCHVQLSEHRTTLQDAQIPHSLATQQPGLLLEDASSATSLQGPSTLPHGKGPTSHPSITWSLRAACSLGCSLSGMLSQPLAN